MNASASSCSASAPSGWPTPRVSAGGYTRDHGDPALERPTLAGLAAMWPTPRTITGGAESAERKQELGRSESGGGDLQAAAMQWPTPIANDHKILFAGEATLDKNARPLREVVGAWASPSGADSIGTTGGGQVKSLRADASQWCTPSVATATGGQASRGQGRQDELLLTGQAKALETTLASGSSSSPAPATSTDGASFSRAGLTLNPLFVEALMLWPPRWTLTVWNASACSATALSAWKRLMRSALSQLASPPEAPPVQPSLFG